MPDTYDYLEQTIKSQQRRIRQLEGEVFGLKIALGLAMFMSTGMFVLFLMLVYG